MPTVLETPLPTAALSVQETAIAAARKYMRAGPNGHPAGTKLGDFIHFFQSGTTEIPTIGSIDPAGDLWVANNWDSVDAATSADPFRPTSTQGGGSGFTVFYGVAAPVKTPLIGTVRQP
jgi:hypothetical protein